MILMLLFYNMLGDHGGNKKEKLKEKKKKTQSK